MSDLPRVIPAHQGKVLSVRFVSPDLLATCGEDGFVRVWTLSDSPSRAFDLGEIDRCGVNLSSDGALLLSTSHKGIFVVDSSDGHILHRMLKLVSPADAAAWSPTADRFAARPRPGFQNPVRLFDRKCKELCAIAHQGDPSGVAFSPCGRLVGIIGNKQLQICSAESGAEIVQQTLRAPGSAIAFSHDGKWLAYGWGTDRVCICSASKLLLERELECGKDPACMAFSPDDSILAIGHTDGLIRLWDVMTGSMRAQLVGHERIVQDVVISPDGRTLLSASNDGTIRLWSVDHARSYGVFYRVDANCRMSLSSDGRRLAVGYGTKMKGSPDVWLVAKKVSHWYGPRFLSVA